MSKNNTCIFKVDKSLEEIIILLDKIYYKPIEVLKDKNITNNEKNYTYKWEKVKSEEEYNIKEYAYENLEFRYLETRACVEVPKMTKVNAAILAELTGNLNKEALVFPKYSDVIFVDINCSTYCIISGSKDLEVKIRSTLMESSLKKESEWGEIIYKNIQEYTFVKGFYYWIISSKEKKTIINNSEDPIQIIDLRGFESDSDNERESSEFSGTGMNIDKRIPLKSIISTNGRLKSLYMNLVYKSTTYSFTLHNDGRIILYLDECGVFGCSTPMRLSYLHAINTIYFKIIPILKREFDSQYRMNWDSYEKELKRNYAIEIIKDLMNDNNISLQMIGKEI